MTTLSHRLTHTITARLLAGAPCLLAGALGAAVMLTPADAQAQENNPSVSPTGKGIAGGALLGAEIVMIPIAIAGVDAWWPYVVFGAVGAGGGAVGGWAVEKATKPDGPSEPALYMLAGGMALIVPTIVAVLNATAYDPTEEEDEQGDEPGTDIPSEVDGEASVEVGARYPGGAPVPLSIVGVDAWSDRPAVGMGIPAVSVQPRFTPNEMAAYGVEQGTEVSIPVVSGSF